MWVLEGLRNALLFMALIVSIHLIFTKDTPEIEEIVIEDRDLEPDAQEEEVDDDLVSLDDVAKNEEEERQKLHDLVFGMPESAPPASMIVDKPVARNVVMSGTSSPVVAPKTPKTPKTKGLLQPMSLFRGTCDGVSVDDRCTQSSPKTPDAMESFAFM